MVSRTSKRRRMMNRRTVNRRQGTASAMAGSFAGRGHYNPFAPPAHDAGDNGENRDDRDREYQDDRDQQGDAQSSRVRQLDQTVVKLTAELQDLKRKLNFLQKIDLSDDNTQGDVSLVTKYGKVIRAHRYILASKSSIFKKMFDTNMTEKSSGEIHIEDIEFSVLRAVVGFLYTAEISFTDEATASEVFKAAHKYDITELQAECETHLSSSVTEENLSEMLKISHVYGTERLKERSIQVFKENFDQVHARVLRDLLSPG